MKKINVKTKASSILAGLTTLLLTKGVQATAVEEISGGGDIQNSKLAQGFVNMIKDLTGTLRWIIPIVGVLFIAWYVFKIMTGDEHEGQRYKKSIVKVLVCVIAGILATTIINLIIGYFM